MKLAEALMARAEMNKDIEDLENRLMRVVKVQEGDEPAQDPVELLEASLQKKTEVRDLIVRINKTNARVIDDEGATINDLLAERKHQHRITQLMSTLLGRTLETGMRYMRTEIKYVVTVDIADIQARKDAAAAAYRELDKRLQALNWQVDLME
ncbi:MAG: DIP1984 family protein [Actinomycetes bacterium]|jgi:glycine cleavage system regulatory protein|nr:DIP1984 family protein [Actinomycetes bacterium]